MANANDEIIIQAKGSVRNYLKEIWQYKELFYFFAWRDLTVRYKQTALGVLWSLIQPLMTLVVFTLVFGKLANLPSGDVPYPLLVLSALLPWQFFSTATSSSSLSIISGGHIVSKVYFPRIALPVSAVIVSVVDLFISLLMLFALFAIFRFMPSWRLGVLPLFLILNLFLAIGVGFWLSALIVRFRDLRFVIPVALQLGLYVSPVGFQSSVVPERWRSIYELNPLVGIIEGMRWSVTGIVPRASSIGISVAITAFVFLSGFFYFWKNESDFADII